MLSGLLALGQVFIYRLYLFRIPRLFLKKDCGQVLFRVNYTNISKFKNLIFNSFNVGVRYEGEF